MPGGNSRDGPSEQPRTRRTRAAVVEASRVLFLERGYVATTVEAISETSETAPATVYRLFGSKLGILKALLDVSIGGDDEDVAVADRPEVRQLLDDPSAAGVIARFAAFLRVLLQRAARVHGILAEAARSDADAAVLLDEVARQRQTGQRRIARSLARSGALRAGLRERDAADLIHALGSPDVYRLLVHDRGWTGERYETWLRTTLTDQLLGPEHHPPERISP